MMRPQKMSRGAIDMAAVGGLLLLQAAAAFGVWVETLAQVDGAGASNINTVLIGAIATALTSTTGVIGWLVKRMFSGEMVHRDVVKGEQLLAAATKALEEGQKREDRLWQQAFPEGRP